jgi:hypothetical protein
MTKMHQVLWINIETKMLSKKKNYYQIFHLRGIINLLNQILKILKKSQNKLSFLLLSSCQNQAINHNKHNSNHRILMILIFQLVSQLKFSNNLSNLKFNPLLLQITINRNNSKKDKMMMIFLENLNKFLNHRPIKLNKSNKSNKFNKCNNLLDNSNKITMIYV